MIAFWHAGGQIPLDCTVFGRLRTGEEQTVVVADEVIFRVGRDVAAAARDRMEDPDAGEPPASPWKMICEVSGAHFSQPSQSGAGA